MSATRVGKCPSCGRESTLIEDYEAYWAGKTFHFYYGAECGGRYNIEGCGFTFSKRLDGETLEGDKS